MFSKVAVNTEIVNTKTLLLGETLRLGSCELLITRFLSTDKYTTLFYVPFCLETPYLIYIAD